MNNIFSIIKKELKSYFDSPTAYIILVVFLILWEFLFFRNAFLFGEASLRVLFGFLPWLFLLLVPAITMGSISQEKSEGTLELLLTHPLDDKKLLLGKYLASVIFATIALLFVIPIAMSFNAFGNLDWGAVVGQYLASVLFVSVLAAMGIFISTIFNNQISSLLVTVAAGFVLVIVGFEIVTATLPLFLAPILERLSILSHFDSMARGVVDLRDLWYFLSATAIFLSLAYLQLFKRRFGSKHNLSIKDQKIFGLGLYNSYRVGIALFIGIAILTNVIGSRIPGRIDLTEDRVYTLTKATAKTIDGINDVLTLTLFASNELPAQMQTALRDTKDMLRDYKILGKGNIVVEYKNPSGNQEIITEANSLGVREAQFNVVSQEEFQVKKGYLGLAISYGGENEVIPFIQDTSDLEYQLTSLIKKLSTNEKKKIVFLSGHGEKSLSQDYGFLNQELQKQFEVTEKVISKPAGEGEEEGAPEEVQDNSIPEDTDVLVVAGPSQKISDEVRASIKGYLDNGGSVLFLIDTVNLTPEMMQAAVNEESFSDFLEEYGVGVQSNIVYDLSSNETVSFGGGTVNYFLPYPLWARVGSIDKTSPITSRIESIVLPWASSIKLDEGKVKENKFIASKLLSTTKFGGTQKGEFFITPDYPFSKENLTEQLMAVSLIGEGAGKDSKATRMVVVGDSDFLTNQFVQNSLENLGLGLEAISWLGQEDSLAGIKLKQKSASQLIFENKTQVSFIKYGNMALALLLPIGFGAYRLMKRKNLKKFSYKV